MAIGKVKTNKSVQKEAKKELKKLKKLKNEFLVLDKKFERGKLNNSETNKYFKLKEELEKMTNKYVIKNGELVLNTEDDKNGDTMKDEMQQQPQPQPQQPQPQQMQQPQQQPQQMQQPQQQPQQMQQPQQQPQPQPQPQPQQPQPQQMQQQPQMQHEQLSEQEIARQQELIKRREIARQQAIERARQQQAQGGGPMPLRVVLYLRESPELSMRILDSAVGKFLEDVETARETGKLFKFGDFYIDVSRLIYLRFVPDNDQS